MTKNNASYSLSPRRKEILQLWLQYQQQENTAAFSLLDPNDLKQQSNDLLIFVLQEIETRPGTSKLTNDNDEVPDIVSLISASHVKNGISPRDTALFVLSLKSILINLLQQNISESTTLMSESFRIDKIIDSLTMITMETYIRIREDEILRNSAEIADISTPVIKVWDGILVLPIIGTLDSARTQNIVENLLTRVVETESSVAILDISGVPAVDSLVAQHLIKTVAATRLMGAECIISGIRPETAQTIVRLGVELPDINTKSTLADALRHAFKILQLEAYKVSEKQ